MLTREIRAHSLLNPVKQPDDYFGLSYTMNLYRGCQHQCIYCDSRSECYGIADFSQIEVKTNGPDLLREELSGKRRKGTVGTGSMHDPYMPVEKEYRLTRSALEVLAEFRFPVHVMTKSTLVLRDTDLLQEISRTYAAVSFSFSTVNDSLARITEPGAPSPTERLEGMRVLSEAGIYTGVCLMPVLPWLGDDHLSIRRALEAFREHGASYVIPAFGLSMRRGQRGYFMQKLKKDFPGLDKRYRAFYRDEYWCPCPAAPELENIVDDLCSKGSMKRGMSFFKAKIEQGDLFA